MSKFYKFWMSSLMLIAVSAGAQNESQEPLSFKAWKEAQQVEAQNQVARVSNRIVLLKAGKLKPEDILAEFGHLNDTDSGGVKLTGRAQKLSSKDVLSRLEREQARSQKNLEFAKDLGIEEYFLGYLNQFQDNQPALAQVAGRLSKDEVTELLRVLLRSNTNQSMNSRKSTRVKSTLGTSASNF